MQALLFLALIGFFYGVIASITASVSHTAMQTKLERIANTKEMFEDIEFVVNEYILGQYTDFRAFDTTFDIDEILKSEEVLPQRAGYTEQQLQQDPWGNDIDVKSANQNFILLAGGGNLVQVPATAVVLISPGPDRKLDTSVLSNPDYLQIMNMEAIEGSDDIIYTFSTIDAMTKMWNSIHSSASKIAALTEFNYKQKYENFLPRIEDYYEDSDNFKAFYDSQTGDFIIDETNLNQWREDLCCDIASNPPYPYMASNTEDVGGDAEELSIPRELTVSLQSPGATAQESYEKMDVTITNGAASSWNINYTVNLDGRDIIE